MGGFTDRGLFQTPGFYPFLPFLHNWPMSMAIVQGKSTIFVFAIDLSLYSTNLVDAHGKGGRTEETHSPKEIGFWSYWKKYLVARSYNLES